MTSQLVIFRAFFRPPTLNLKKNSRKSTNKNLASLADWEQADKKPTGAYTKIPL